MQPDLDNARRGVRAAMRPHVTPGNVHGLVFALKRGDETIIDAMGRMGVEGSAPMRDDAIFRIASLTKPVTGVAAMILVERGLIRLEEPVDRLLPELADRRVLKRLDGPIDDTVPAARPILVEDLLTCCMGMGAILSPGDYPINTEMFARGVGVGPWLPDAPSGDAWIAALAELPLMNQPGETWMYDTSITALGVLIERASRQSLGDFFRAEILEPLDMADTGFHVPAEKLDRLPTCYWRNYRTGAFEVFDPAGAESRFATPPGFASAAGGLVSTVRDYLVFASAMLGRGAFEGRRLISEASYAAMTTDHITPAQKARSPFGPGFWDTTGWGYCVAIRKAVGPGDPDGIGWDGGYGTTCCWNHDGDSIGLLLTQRLMDSPAAPAHFTDFWQSAGPALGSNVV